MKSLYMGCARRGSNSEEWISTHTDGFFSRKSSGNSVYGIRWNHISFTALPSERRSESFREQGGRRAGSRQRRLRSRCRGQRYAWMECEGDVLMARAGTISAHPDPCSAQM